MGSNAPDCYHPSSMMVYLGREGGKYKYLCTKCQRFVLRDSLLEKDN